MIYLDNSATSPIRREVYEAMIPYLTTEYGNPSSKHYELAVNAKKAIDHAREQVAKFINAKPEEIIFTSGATESNNMIIKGVADYQKLYEGKGNHIITSQVEHKATLNTCRFLNGDIYSNKDASFSFDGSIRKVDRGYEVSFLEVTETGKVSEESLKKELRKTSIIASIIWGNNEIATLNDIKRLSEICHSDNVMFHTDATQVLGKLDVDVQKLDIDFMSASAHKIGGPKGIGLAFIKSESDYGLPPISSLIHGGDEQESGLRGSTLAVHNIVGFGKAAELAYKEKEIIYNFYQTLDKEIIPLLQSTPGIKLIGDLADRLPGIYSVVVEKEDFYNDTFLTKIKDDFSLSTGSACTAGQPSHVLQAIGLGAYVSKVLRISIGAHQPINETIRAIQSLLSFLLK